MADETPNAAANRGPSDVPSRIEPLSEHRELEIADGYPEVRGWDVRDFTGRSVGYVYDVLIDIDAMRVWYLDVLLDSAFAGDEADPRVLVPIERTELDGSTESVLLRGIDAAGVRTLAPFAHRGVRHDREDARPSRSEQEPALAKPRVEEAAVDVQVKLIEVKPVELKPIDAEWPSPKAPAVPVASQVKRGAAVTAAQEVRSQQKPLRDVRSAAGVGSATRAEPEVAHPAGRRQDRMRKVTTDRLDIDIRRPSGNGRARIDSGESLGELVKRLSGDATHLIQQEVALAKIELREAGETLGRDAAKIGMAVGFALPGVFALTAFLVVGLGDLLDNYWLAALIVGVLFLGIGGFLARDAIADIKRRGLTPKATVETVREDTEWAKREMRELKQNMSRDHGTLVATQSEESWKTSVLPGPDPSAVLRPAELALPGSRSETRGTGAR